MGPTRWCISHTNTLNSNFSRVSLATAHYSVYSYIPNETNPIKNVTGSFKAELPFLLSIKIHPDLYK